MNNLNFTDQLIEEHLSSGIKQGQDAKYVERDSKLFREFIERTYHSKD